MAPTGSLVNLTTGYGDTTAEPHNSEFCPPYPRALFETVDTTVPYIVNAALNVPLATTATFANLLVLLAMRQITSIRLPSKLLLCTLVLTDFGAGLIVQPQFVVFLFMKANNAHRVNCFLVKLIYVTGSMFSGVSLLTITAISLDRYTALYFHHRYQEIVTIRRVSGVLAFIWSLSLFGGLTTLWSFVLWDIIKIPGIVICFLVISVTCIKINRGLQAQHGQQVQPQATVQSQQQARNTLNMSRYKRIASTMLWIYALFTLCYLPQVSVFVITAFKHTALIQCINEFSHTVVLLNSCLNPFVYGLLLPGIRADVLQQLRKCCCRSTQQ